MHLSNFKNIILIVLLGLLFIPIIGKPQDRFKNPFFDESNFFISAYEKNIFSNLEKNVKVESLPLFFAITRNEPEKNIQFSNQLLEEFYNQVSFKNHQHEKARLKKIFTEVHKRFLKKYQRYASFDRLFVDGSYDCLTGTALYAIVLDFYKFKYTIHETALHSYLIVHASSGDILFESTDPLEGFVNDQKNIAEMEARYSREMEPEFNNISGLTGYKESGATVRYYNEKITLTQLAGLQYFNQAVISYNLGNYESAVRFLEKSYTIYPCKRIALLLLNSVQKVLNDPLISRKEIRIYSGKTSYYTKGSQKYFD